MKTDLYQPTLTQEGVRKTESYALDRLFYVAFFGGTVALAGLSAVNAKTLRMGGNTIVLMIALAAAVLSVKGFFYYSFFHDVFDIERQALRFVARGLDLALFGVFYFLMKRDYKTHMMLHGETRPMWKAALGWILLSIVTEAIILAVVAAI